MVSFRIYLFLFVMVSSLALNQLLIYHGTSKRDEVISIVNVAGRQRMLSEGMLRIAFQARADSVIIPGRLKSDLFAYIQQFRNADSTIVNSKEANDDTREQLLAMKAWAGRLTASAYEIFNSDNRSELMKSTDSLIQIQPKFLQSMEAVVKAFEQSGNQKLKQRETNNTVASVISFLLTLIAFFYAVIPVLKSLEKQNVELITKNEQIKSNLEQILDLRESIAKNWERYKVFIEQAPGAMAMFDKDMRYLVASKKWCSDYGLTSSDIVGVSHYDIFPEITEERKQIHRECLLGAVSHSDGAPFERADGSIQWLAWEVRPWTGSDGEIGGLLIYTADITEFVNLRSEQEKLARIFAKVSEIARIGAWKMNLPKGTMYWSDVTRQILEVNDAYIPDIHSVINHIKEGENRDRFLLAMERALVIGNAFDLELEVVTEKNKAVWTRIVGEPEILDGKCVRLLGIIQDIQHKKRQELKISKLLSELTAILNSATEIAIMSTNMDGVITQFSLGAEKLLGYKAEELVGWKTPLFLLDPEIVEKRTAEFRQRIGQNVDGFEILAFQAKQAQAYTQEWNCVKKNGSRLSVLLSITSLRDESGSMTGFLCVATDLTEIIRLKEQALENNKALESLTTKLTHQNLQLASFAHITSHNLRSPVSNLNSLLSFLKSSTNETDREMLMQKFEIVINHLTGTLETLVDALKIRESTHHTTEPLMFHEMLRKTEDILVAQLKESGAIVNSDFTHAPFLEYNREYLESIFLNMLTNAIKYRSPARRLELMIRSRRLQTGKVELIFSDNGSGIDLNRNGKKIFGLNKTFHKNKDAKGVGLFMTKTQIESMGGSISADSEVDVGTTFLIKF